MYLFGCFCGCFRFSFCGVIIDSTAIFSFLGLLAPQGLPVDSSADSDSSDHSNRHRLGNSQDLQPGLWNQDIRKSELLSAFRWHKHRLSGLAPVREDSHRTSMFRSAVFSVAPCKPGRKVELNHPGIYPAADSVQVFLEPTSEYLCRQRRLWHRSVKREAHIS